MGFEEAMDAIARGVEILGIMTLVLGLAAALVRAGLALLGSQGAEEVYRIVRTVFGRSGSAYLCSGATGVDGGAADPGIRARLVPMDPGAWSTFWDILREALESVGSSTRLLVYAPAAISHPARNGTRTGWRPQPARTRQTESRVSSSTSCQSWRAPGWNTYSSGAS
jgi:hypothetical protein